ncbi:transcription factor bHLH148 [Eucalyptus grandis]|uniref:transcription factor bHLH148 n=1 Tax=Eucalyptus grandis TaxID=71139 RepID=UPI000527CA9F|nr:transcription factor bHLH148 [Eucalyptus grandis]
MSSSLISPNPIGTSNPAAAGADRSREAKTRRRKKKAQAQAQAQSKARSLSSKWKSQAQQQIFSSNLLRALAQSRRRGGGGVGGGGSSGGRAVREAADRALAASAKGRTRWSRAILAGRIRISKFRKRKRPAAAVAAAAAAAGRSRKPRVSVSRLRGKGIPAVQRKVRFLGRLVPGCRKEPLPVILEEATDYIEALEMQVRAMSELARLLSGGASVGAGSSSGSPPEPLPGQ